jgi:glyoxylate utilization-related uncharacterized protein
MRDPAGVLFRHRHQLSCPAGPHAALAHRPPDDGLSETFSQYVMEVAPGGGSDAPNPTTGARAVIFVTEGWLTLTIDGRA